MLRLRRAQAKVKIYPDSAHGFLFQDATEFATDVERFLSGETVGHPAAGTIA